MLTEGFVCLFVCLFVFLLLYSREILLVLLNVTLSFIVDQQVRELEVDLDNETRRSAEQQKISKKTERRLKDVLQQQEEDQKNLQHFKDQIDRLNKKIKSTKVNQEDAVRPLSSVLVLSSLLLPPSP